MIADGIDAISISSAGERPLPADADAAADLSPKTVDDFGRAVQSIVSALDVATEDPIHGPSTWIEVGDNLVPGWALAALALALILPALVAAVDSCARSARQGLALGASAAWAAARCLPFVGGLAILYALSFVGAVPRPEFPFDPGLYALETRALIVFAVVALAAAASAWLLRRRGITARAAPDATPYGLGLVSALAALALWLANPYLALLAAPAAHVWLLSGAESIVRRALAAVACALVCVPVLAALAAVASALDLGADAPWTYALMVVDGQIGLPTMLAAELPRGRDHGGAGAGPPPTGLDPGRRLRAAPQAGTRAPTRGSDDRLGGRANGRAALSPRRSHECEEQRGAVRSRLGEPRGCRSGGRQRKVEEVEAGYRTQPVRR